MSYCRWSSDSWKCDVYCYEHVDGSFATHIAGRMYKDGDTKTALVEIGLPYDGESFYDPSLKVMRERLVELKDLGYNVPSFVFESIDEELNVRDENLK